VKTAEGINGRAMGPSHDQPVIKSPNYPNEQLNRKFFSPQLRIVDILRGRPTPRWSRAGSALPSAPVHRRSPKLDTRIWIRPLNR